LVEKTLAALEKANLNAEEKSNVVLGNLQQQLRNFLITVEQQRDEIKALNQALYGNDGDVDDKAKASIAKDVLEVALRQEIDQGLVAVEQRKDTVIITVGSGGAFPSGTAELTFKGRGNYRENCIQCSYAD
jgi:chemotaxis protein MotB